MVLGMVTNEEEFNKGTERLQKSGYIGALPSYKDWTAWCEKNKDIWYENN